MKKYVFLSVLLVLIACGSTGYRLVKFDKARLMQLEYMGSEPRLTFFVSYYDRIDPATGNPKLNSKEVVAVRSEYIVMDPAVQIGDMVWFDGKVVKKRLQ